MSKPIGSNVLAIDFDDPQDSDIAPLDEEELDRRIKLFLQEHEDRRKRKRNTLGEAANFFTPKW